MQNRFAAGDTVEVDIRETLNDDDQLEAKFVFTVIDHEEIEAMHEDVLQEAEAILA